MKSLCSVIISTFMFALIWVPSAYASATSDNMQSGLVSYVQHGNQTDWFDITEPSKIRNPTTAFCVTKVFYNIGNKDLVYINKPPGGEYYVYLNNMRCEILLTAFKTEQEAIEWIRKNIVKGNIIVCE